MGRIAEVLSVEKLTDQGANVREVKADLGGGDVVTADLMLPPGDDAEPLPGDFVELVGGSGTGSAVAVGFFDPKNEGTAGPGERRIYARDADGAPVAAVWCKADGSIEIEVLKSGGAPVVIRTEGAVSVVADSVSIQASGVAIESDDVAVGTGGGEQSVALADALLSALSDAADAAISAGAPQDGGKAAFAQFKSQLASAQIASSSLKASGP